MPKSQNSTCFIPIHVYPGRCPPFESNSKQIIHRVVCDCVLRICRHFLTSCWAPGRMVSGSILRRGQAGGRPAPGSSLSPPQHKDSLPVTCSFYAVNMWTERMSRNPDIICLIMHPKGRGPLSGLVFTKCHIGELFPRPRCVVSLPGKQWPRPACKSLATGYQRSFSWKHWHGETVKSNAFYKL